MQSKCVFVDVPDIERELDCDTCVGVCVCVCMCVHVCSGERFRSSGVWQPPVEHVQERPRSACWDTWQVAVATVLWLTDDLEKQWDAEEQKDGPPACVCVHMWVAKSKWKCLCSACATAPQCIYVTKLCVCVCVCTCMSLSFIRSHTGYTSLVTGYRCCLRNKIKCST